MKNQDKLAALKAEIDAALQRSHPDLASFRSQLKSGFDGVMKNVILKQSKTKPEIPLASVWAETIRVLGRFSHLAANANEWSTLADLRIGAEDYPSLVNQLEGARRSLSPNGKNLSDTQKKSITAKTTACDLSNLISSLL